MGDLRELEKAATPAPWKIGPGTHRVSNGTEIVCGAWNEYGCGPEADAALITALRNAAPFLLDVVEAARDHMAATVEARRTPVAWAGMPPTEGRLHDALLALDSHRRNP